jgi:CARDB
MVRCRWALLAVLMTGIFIVSCSSPGEPFAYKDIKFSAGPSAPVSPTTTQAVTISFTIRNTWDQELSAVPWELHLTASDPVIAAVNPINSGTVTIPAFGSITQSINLGILPKGSRTYEVRLDPANVINEEVETNNIGQVTVFVADQDISFGTAVPTITVDAGSPPASQTLTATFSILHTVNTVAPAPAAVAISVPYTFTLNGVVVLTASATVDPAVTNPLPITVSLPATGSAGTFPYILTLSPAAGDDSNLNNNSVTVIVSIPASG